MSDDADENDDEDLTPRIRNDRAWKRTPISNPSLILAELERHELTDPLDHFTRGPDDDDRSVIDALGRNPDDPVTLGIAIREHNSRMRHETAQDAAIRGLANRQLKLGDLSARLDDAERWQAEAKRWAERARKAAWGLLGTFVLSLGTVAGTIWHRANQEGGDAVRLQRLEEDMREQRHQLERAVDQLRDEIQHFRAEPSAFQFQSKGNIP